MGGKCCLCGGRTNRDAKVCTKCLQTWNRKQRQKIKANSLKPSSAKGT